ncbi:YxlC family protein [Mesobacillus jeotgali]|uniref:YxlC family protein n=1 Tax=Mesobacillus jeotgali TaxID=129985 RepID=UPI0009A5F144|nr:YxlC family protein [Mesobacillus jeotgali]
MKNQKGISSNDDQMDKEFFETISAIQNGLDKLESMDLYTPDEKWFGHMVLRQQEIQKKNFLRELTWFILSAMLILTVVIFTLLELPILFLMLQTATVAIAGFFGYKGMQKQVDTR